MILSVLKRCKFFDSNKGLEEVVGIKINGVGLNESLEEFLGDGYYESEENAVREVYGAGGRPNHKLISLRCKSYYNKIPKKQLPQTILSIQCSSRISLTSIDRKIVSFELHNRL